MPIDRNLIICRNTTPQTTARYSQDRIGRHVIVFFVHLNAIQRKLNPLKSKFLFTLKTIKNPNYYVKNMRKIISIYDRTNKGLLSRAFKTWHEKVTKLDTNQLKKAFFLKSIHTSLDGSSHKVYITVVDAAGNYQTKSFEEYCLRLKRGWPDSTNKTMYITNLLNDNKNSKKKLSIIKRILNITYV